MRRKSIKELIALEVFKLNPRYQMTVDDCFEIKGISNDMFVVLDAAFRYGYLQGTKAEKARAKREN